MTRILTLFWLALVVSGCAYEQYDLIVGDYMLEGIAISSWRDVRQVGSKIQMSPGSRFAIRVNEQTQYLAQFDIEILSGTGLNLYTRAVAHDFSQEDGIAFRYAVDGCEIRNEGGEVQALNFNADFDVETIKLLSEADQVEFSVGCERLYEGLSNLEQTEYIIIETLPDTEIRLSAINYYDIDEI